MSTSWRPALAWRPAALTWQGLVPDDDPADPFASMLDLLYTPAPYGFARTCLVEGASFDALIDTVDALSFDAVAVGTHQIRYRSRTATLATGATLSIDRAHYRVLGVPKQINTDESLAQLVKVAA